MSLSLCTISLNETAVWSSGELWNGSVLLFYVYPELSGGNYNAAIVAGADRTIEAPKLFELPIRDGELNPASPEVLRTDLGLVPPGGKFLDFWIDQAGALVAAGGSLGSIESVTKTLTVPTLTAPTSETDLPQLGGTNRGEIQNLISSSATTLTRQTFSGTGTGFTLTRNATLEVLYLNGLVLQSGVDYNRSGTAITLTFTKESGDALEALLLG